MSRTILSVTFLDLWILAIGETYHLLAVDSKHILPSRQSCSSPEGCCCLFGSVTVTSKGYYIFNQASCFRMVGKPVDSMIVSPLIYFSDCEVCSLVRSNTMQNTILVNKAFCTSMVNSFGRSITCKKDKPIARIIIYSNKNYLFCEGNGLLQSICH